MQEEHQASVAEISAFDAPVEVDNEMSHLVDDEPTEDMVTVRLFATSSDLVPVSTKYPLVGSNYFQCKNNISVVPEGY